MTETKSDIREVRFANGLTLVHLHTKSDPVSACHLFLPSGASQETDAKSGVATLRWSLLMKGSQRRSARRLAEDIESLGASVSGGATQDYSEISCHSASPYFAATIQTMAEVMFEPAFRTDEVEKEKESLLASIRSKKESIFSTASETFNKKLYGSHPYSRPSSGVETSVKNLQAHDLSQWDSKHLSPDGAFLAVANDVPFERIQKQMQDLFGPAAWPKQKKGAVKLPAVKPISQSAHITLHEKFEQAYLMIGFPINGVDSMDFVTAKTLNGVLGGGMSTRLFQELREKQGLAYDVGSYYPSKLSGSAFVVYLGLQASRIEQAKKRIHEILEEVQHDGVPDDELAMVKNYLKGTYLLDHQTNSQRAHYLGWWRILGRPASYDRDYIQQINRVRSDDVLSTARKIFTQKNVTVEIRPKKKAT